jgi:hypothetical protein
MSAIRLLPVPNTLATGTLTLSGNAVADETVTIGAHVYTWKAAVTTTANQVLVGANAAASIVNLVAAINRTAADAGTKYGSLTAANVYVTAADGPGDTVVVTALPAYEGPLGATVVTTETMTAGAWGAATLTGAGATASAALAIPLASPTASGVELPFLTDQAVLLVRSVLGSGTMTATIRLWGYFPSTQRWYALGTGTNQGYVNGGAAISEISTAADRIAQAEGVAGLRRCSRIYAEIIGVLGGTATEIEVYLDCVPASAVTGN